MGQAVGPERRYDPHIISLKPATVLYVAWAPFFSGAERALLILAEHLDRTKYRPIVAVGTDGELAEALRSRGIETIHVPIVYAEPRRLVSWAAAVARLMWFARRERAALIHANDAPSFQPAGYVAKLSRLPAVTHVRFPDTADGFRWFLKPGFAHALFVSEGLRSGLDPEARAVFGNRSEVVYDGVHVPGPVSDVERAGLRQELGLPSNLPVVVIAGQVSEIKGIWDYIEAASILIGRGVRVSFAVLGDDLRNNGALRLEAERAVEARGLSAHVRFLGFRPNAPRLIPAFDIVAVPSHIEPLGNATLEAMATARPVIGSRVGGIPEMVVEGKTGLLVPPQQPAALADAIEQLVRDPQRARALGEAGRERAISAFGIQAHVHHVQSIYDRLLTHPSGLTQAQQEA